MRPANRISFASRHEGYLEGNYASSIKRGWTSSDAILATVFGPGCLKGALDESSREPGASTPRVNISNLG